MWLILSVLGTTDTFYIITLVMPWWISTYVLYGMYGQWHIGHWLGLYCIEYQNRFCGIYSTKHCSQAVPDARCEGIGPPSLIRYSMNVLPCLRYLGVHDMPYMTCPGWRCHRVTYHYRDHWDPLHDDPWWLLTMIDEFVGSPVENERRASDLWHCNTVW